MKRAEDLKQLLERIDHKGYPAYKETKGSYQWEKYVLCIEHVQGDPFAAPSKVSLTVPGKCNGFFKMYYENKEKRVAFQDYLLRRMAKVIRAYSFKAKGSGKSGLLGISQPGQEVLERSACQVNPENGDITVRMEIGFPAQGRSIQARELIKILFDFLPKCVEQSLFQKAYQAKELEQVVFLAEDQQYIREQLKEQGLVAFVADGAVLPRKSGVSDLPMQGGVTFTSPESMRVTMHLPHKGSITGMGIREEITLVVGGGYHGKSTLLRALELGVYNHIAGDGREYVITDETAVKLRAEDGRSIQSVDISAFIRNLPNGKDTTAFFTENASGSTSQAANTMEAVEMGAAVFLIDEDTSATNFMIRDELMQRVVHRDMEPITPFIDRVEELYRDKHISTILVAGSSGAYFYKADTIIQMKKYEPVDITAQAKKEAEAYGALETVECEHVFREAKRAERVAKRDGAFLGNDRNKKKVMGLDGFSVNRETVDLRYVEQLTDTEQVNALAEILIYLKKHEFDGKKTVQEAVSHLMSEIGQKGFAAFTEGKIPGNLVIPREQEIFAMLNRCRELVQIECRRNEN